MLSKEISALDKLIQRLNETPLLTDQEEKIKHKRFISSVTDNMLDLGVNYGKASGDLSIYNQSEKKFKLHIRKIDNDLIRQISIFNFGLDRWFAYGEIHPPYFPLRIAIILSKNSEIALEKLFLSSYCRHFMDRKGNTDEIIVKRAIKKGAIIGV